MKLCEHEGKALFQKYEIAIPRSLLLGPDATSLDLSYPLIIKSQVPTSDRKAKGGILIVENEEGLLVAIQKLFTQPIDGHIPEFLLAEELLHAKQELYVSFSYSTEHRAPVLALNLHGGTGVREAVITPVDILTELALPVLHEALERANIKPTDELILVIQKLWKLFREEGVLQAEINPLFVLDGGALVAGDAKVVSDDALSGALSRPFISLGGNIAVIASGGGASMLNIDILMRAGGEPANYVEYSGNPPRALVEELTMRVLTQPNLKGAWVVGGTANFTDIYETMSGFVDGLRKVTHKPTYPIVIRRDGPRQEEARAMLQEVADKEGYNMHVFGSEISMAESAERLMSLIRKKI